VQRLEGCLLIFLYVEGKVAYCVFDKHVVYYWHESSQEQIPFFLCEERDRRPMYGPNLYRDNKQPPRKLSHNNTNHFYKHL
jgi:hypothetical protein